MRFDIQFPFYVRQAVCVATSIARAIDVDLRFKRQLLESDDTKSSRIPTVLRIETEGSQDNGRCDVRVRFERGTVVEVQLFDRNELLEHWRKDRQDWVIYQASARYYHLDSSYSRVSDVKLEMEFSSTMLTRLRDSGLGWYHPHVVAISDITAEVGIFWNRAQEDGYVDPDFEENQQGHYSLVESVTYPVLISGARDQAIREAEEKLANYSRSAIA